MSKFLSFEKIKNKQSDLHVLWAIRDIPASVLNVKHKGILCMFLALIGNRGSCYYTLKQLENKLGISVRRAQDHFHYLEEIGFLIIKRPVHYTHGESNEYCLNYKLILSTAEHYRSINGGNKSPDESSDRYISPDESSADMNKSPDESSDNRRTI